MFLKFRAFWSKFGEVFSEFQQILKKPGKGGLEFSLHFEMRVDCADAAGLSTSRATAE